MVVILSKSSLSRAEELSLVCGEIRNETVCRFLCEMHGMTVVCLKFPVSWLVSRPLICSR